MICLAALNLTGCKDGVSPIAIYVSKPAEGGLVRRQKEEGARPAFLPFAATDGFFCVSGEDMELILGSQIDRLEK